MKIVYFIISLSLLFLSGYFLLKNDGSLDAELKLPIDQDFSIQNTEYIIEFKEVIEDSRCPSKVTCIQAGTARLVFSIYENDNKLRDFNLSIMESTQVGDYNIELTDVYPYPTEPGSVDREKYIAMLKISSIYT